MSGVPSLGGRRLAPDASPGARALASDLDHLGLQVAPENVLAARNVLRGEAQRLREMLRSNQYRLHIEPHAADPVSQAAAPLFNAKIEVLKVECQAYVDALDRAGLALEQTAREYGRAEHDITDSLNFSVGRGCGRSGSGSPRIATPLLGCRSRSRRSCSRARRNPRRECCSGAPPPVVRDDRACPVGGRACGGARGLRLAGPSARRASSVVVSGAELTTAGPAGRAADGRG